MQDDVQETEVRETNLQDGNTAVQKQTVARSSQVSSAVIAQRIV